MKLLKRLLPLLALLCCGPGPAWAQSSGIQLINIGAAPNDGTGDSIRGAFAKDNANWILDTTTLQVALTGCVTTPGNSNATSVTPGCITLPMLAPMNPSSFMCNASGASLAPSYCSVATAQTLFASNSGGSASVCFSGAATWVACGGGGGGFPTLSMPAVFAITGNATSTINVAANMTAGGIIYAPTATTLASSVAMTANRILLGGGLGSPFPMSSGGVTIQVLCGNASGPPSWCTLNLASMVGTTVLPSLNGGNGVANSFTQAIAGGNVSWALPTNETVNLPSPPSGSTIWLANSGMPQARGAPLTVSTTLAQTDQDTEADFNCAGAGCVATLPQGLRVGTLIGFHVICGNTNSITITVSSGLLYWSNNAGSSSPATGNRTLINCGYAVARQESATTWTIQGSPGLSLAAPPRAPAWAESVAPIRGPPAACGTRAAA